jgi:hypothetical protein
LAASPLLEGVAGHYFNDCNEARPVDRRPSEIAKLIKGDIVARYALDPGNSERLWKRSLELLGIS